MKLHEKAILRLKTEPRKNLLLSTSYDNTVCLCSVAETGILSVMSRYYFKYTCDGIAFSPKHNSILIAERNMPFINYISMETQEKKEISINQHE